MLLAASVLLFVQVAAPVLLPAPVTASADAPVLSTEVRLQLHAAVEVTLQLQLVRLLCFN